MLSFSNVIYLVMCVVNGSMDTAVVYCQILKHRDIHYATDLFDQWLQESSKESYEVPNNSSLRINHLDPHFRIGQNLVIFMMELWRTSRFYYNNCAIRTFYYLSSNAFVNPLLTQPAWYSLLCASIDYGPSHHREVIMQYLLSTKQPGV